MSAVAIFSHWTVCRTLAMLSAGVGNLDPECVAGALNCDMDDAMDAIDQAAATLPPGFYVTLYSKAGAH